VSTSKALLELLSTDAQTPPGPAVGTFAGNSVSSLVLSVDKTLVNANGDTLFVWASTYSKP